MGAVKNLVFDVQGDIDLGELSFEQIAVKHGISLREVDALALELLQEEMYHDELERDHDEPYEHDETFELDDGYEDRYLDAVYE